MADANQPACIFSPYEDVDLLAPIAVTTENDSKIRKNLTTEFRIQDSKMDVFLRIRPLTSKERTEDLVESCVEIQSKKNVLLKAPTTSATFRNNPHDVHRLNTKFTFTEIFGAETTQQDFYLSAVDKTVQEFLNGKNCLVFAYGATNSGKTHTVQGPRENPGVIPLALEVIFHNLKDHLADTPQYRPISSVAIEELPAKDQDTDMKIKESLLASMSDVYHFYSSKESVAVSQESLNMFENSNIITSSKVTVCDEILSNSSFLIYVSFAEIYNEQLFDLLSHCSDPKKRPKLNLVHDASGNPFIRGLRKIWVSSMDEAHKLLYLGHRNLHMASTKLNEQSSRSHCIFSIYVIRVINSEPVLAYINNLSFCDLAGSERVVKTKNTGERLKEAGNINTSLMVLGRCIDILRNNQTNPKDKLTTIVPYRDSKLTRLFQSFFNGQGKASMIVNVAPNCAMFDDTLRVMKFSALAKQVVTKDTTDRSILNFSSISERLTNFWVKSNRRWSSIAENCPKQSIMTIPEASGAEWHTIAEDDEEKTEIDEEQIEDILHNIKEWTSLVEEHEQTISELKKRNKELEKEVAEIAQRTKDRDYTFFREHMKSMEANHKEALERQEEIANEILNRRTQLLEDYIAKISSKGQTIEDDEEDSDNENETTDYDRVAEKLESSQHANETLKKENSGLKDNIQKLLEEFNLMKSQIEDQEKQASLEARHKMEIDQLKQEIALFQEKETNLQSKLSSASNQLNKSQVEFEKLLASTQHANETLKKENSEIRDNFQKLLEELDSMKSQINDSENKISSIEALNMMEKGKLNQNIALLNETKTNLQSQLLSASTKLKEYQEKFDILKISRKNESSEEQDLNNEDETTAYDRVVKKLKYSQHTNETLRKEKVELLEEFNSTKSQIEALEKQITSTKIHNSMEIDQLKLELKSSQNVNESLKNENVELKDNFQKLLGEFNSTKSQMEDREKQILSIETHTTLEIDQLKQDVVLLQEKESNLQNELSSASTKLNESRVEFDKLVNILLEKDSKVSELMDEVRDLESKLSELSKESILKPKTRAATRTQSRRKKSKPVPDTSSEDESSTNTPMLDKNVFEVPVALAASRSPLAVLDSVMQQSATIGPAYNAVKRGIDRVTKAFSPNSPTPLSTTKSRPKRQMRKLYKGNTDLLEISPTNDSSPPKIPRTLRTRARK